MRNCKTLIKISSMRIRGAIRVLVWKEQSPEPIRVPVRKDQSPEPRFRQICRDKMRCPLQMQRAPLPLDFWVGEQAACSADWQQLAAASGAVAFYFRELESA